MRRTGSLPVASFTATKLRWLRDAEPDNAARVAAVCLPHDWLTWRLRGYGPDGESPLGPELSELVTDRSDASGTSDWSPAGGTYDHDMLVRALGHDAILPRVLGPAEGVPGPASWSDPAPGTTPLQPSAWTPGRATWWSRWRPPGTVFAATGNGRPAPSAPSTAHTRCGHRRAYLSRVR